MNKINSDHIFVGYTSDFERCLLYKFPLGFIDLQSGNVYNNDDILLNTLVSCKNLLNIGKSSTIKKVVHNFEREEDREIKLDNVFIGDVCEVGPIKEINFFRNNFKEDSRYQLTFNSMKLLTSRLFERQYHLFQPSTYNDMITGSEYPYMNYIEPGDVLVPDETLVNIRKLLHIPLKVETMTKKEIIYGYVNNRSMAIAEKIMNKRRGSI